MDNPSERCNLELLADSYRGIMTEVRCRFDFIKSTFNDCRGDDRVFVMECVALNMRLISESITSAVMTANIPKSLQAESDRMKIINHLHDDWEPGKRISRLEKLIGPNNVSFPYSHDEKGNLRYVDREFIKKIFGICGDTLHRESVKKNLRGDDFPEKMISRLERRMEEIDNFHRDIKDFLKVHSIDISEGVVLNCAMYPLCSEYPFVFIEKI